MIIPLALAGAFAALVYAVYRALHAVGDAADRLIGDWRFWIGWLFAGSGWVGFVATGYAPWI